MILACRSLKPYNFLEIFGFEGGDFGHFFFMRSILEMYFKCGRINTLGFHNFNFTTKDLRVGMVRQNPPFLSHSIFNVVPFSSCKYCFISNPVVKDSGFILAEKLSNLLSNL